MNFGLTSYFKKLNKIDFQFYSSTSISEYKEVAFTSSVSRETSDFSFTSAIRKANQDIFALHSGVIINISVVDLSFGITDELRFVNC
jgi:hypothetical protein